MSFCTCADWFKIKDRYEVFSFDEAYGWIIKWAELTKEGDSSSLVNYYGMRINFCPMCGKKLIQIA